MSGHTRWTPIEAWCPTCGEPVTAHVAVTGFVPDGLGFVHPDIAVDRTAHTCTSIPGPWDVPNLDIEDAPKRWGDR